MDEEDKTVAGFMSSHLDSGMVSFRENLVNLMQRALECRMHVTVLYFAE